MHNTCHQHRQKHLENIMGCWCPTENWTHHNVLGCPVTQAGEYFKIKRQLVSFMTHTPYSRPTGGVGRNPSFVQMGLTGGNPKKNYLTGEILKRMDLRLCLAKISYLASRPVRI